MQQFDEKVKGIAAWVNVDAPDKPKWDTQGKDYYTITVRAPKARVAHVCKKINEMNKAAFGKAAKSAHRPFEVDDDGIVSIKAKSRFQPAVFDIRGNPMEYPTRLGSGSLVIVAMRFKTYKTNKRQFGTTAYIQGIQVLKLKKYMGGQVTFGDATHEIDAEDEEMFEAFEAAEDAEDETAEGEEEAPWDEEGDEDLSAADF